MPNKNQASDETFREIRQRSKIPRSEGIDLTFKCNNHCIFCYDGFRRKKITDLSLEQTKSRVIHLKNRGINLITLRGSEPTVYPFIFELIRFIKNNNLKFRLTTNARLFSYEDVTKTFVKMGLIHVYTSLHSNKAKIHDNLTRAIGSFEQTVKGIKNLLKHGVEVETNTTILKQNVGHLGEIAKFLSEEFDSLSRIRFSSLYHVGVEADTGVWYKIMPPLSEIRNSLTEAMGLVRKKGIYSFIEKLPVCGAPKYSPDFKPENYILRANKKPSICSACKYYHSYYCVGVSSVYLQLYGEKDLIPQ